MKYEYELLPVGDADAIIIRHFIGDEQFVIVIDAGNIGDGAKIKRHIKKYFDTNYIDLTICTHPDSDHKDGFFELLEDEDITIEELWLSDPAYYMDETDIKKYHNRANAINALRKMWCKSDDETKNLIDLAIERKVVVRHVIDGIKHSQLPISVVGPTEDYYLESAKLMIEEYGVQTYDESDKNKYDTAFQISDDEAKSVIDGEEDSSPFNASSLILLYEPGDGKRLLFAGDANTTSIQMMIDKYKWLRNVDLLKVPHHGSKRNMNTKLIDALNPKKSYISSAGTVKHPCNALVYWLSKHGPVYSSHQCSGYLHCASSEMPARAGAVRIKPLREKQKL